MSQKLISHSRDLKRLQDEGYEIEVKGGYLLVHQIPYLNSRQEIKRGTLVTDLTLINDKTAYAPNAGKHVISFIGEQPCNKDGSVITGILLGSNQTTLASGITVNFTFSNKPKPDDTNPIGDYRDYYHKVTRYAEIISAPAKSLDGSLSEITFKLIPDEDYNSVFQYLDTNSSRASIDMINAKLNNQRIGIIGLGGTGSYILDLVAKTPVQEIHLFDGDVFFQHNAFRSPGAASKEQLDRRLKKVTYFSEVYAKMHKNIIPHEYFIDETNVAVLNSMTCVFICVDKDSVRNCIMSHLLNFKIPFIDTGIGVNVVDDYLIGALRVTTGTAEKHDHIPSRISTADNDDDIYATNIQIADLNAMAAALAVIKWKKITGFYHDSVKEHHTIYAIDLSQLRDEDHTA